MFHNPGGDWKVVGCTLPFPGLIFLSLWETRGCKDGMQEFLYILTSIRRVLVLVGGRIMSLYVFFPTCKPCLSWDPICKWYVYIILLLYNYYYYYYYHYYYYCLHINLEFLTTKNDIPTNWGPLLFELKHAILLTHIKKFNSSPLKNDVGAR